MRMQTKGPVAWLAIVVSSIALSGCGGGESTAREEGPAAVAPAAAGSSALPAPSEARAVVLGTVQDGGLPHAGCTCERCERARNDPRFDRSVAALGLVLPGGGTYLIDATPDIAEQVHRLRRFRPQAPQGQVDRTPIDGIFLTHAHIGHYLGLAQLGFEVMHSRGTPVYATPRMSAFLRDNGPWSQLVALGNIELVESPAGEPIELPGGVTVTPFSVPHRDEYADTVAYRVEGPRRTLIWVPDTEPWPRWEPALEEVLEGVDIAFLDGTFYSGDELPGRPVSSIGHPLMVDTLERLGERARTGRPRVVFVHLNHSNPTLMPRSREREVVEAAGFLVAEEGMEIPL